MVCFDFDGTITSRYTLLLLLKEAAGWQAMALNLLKELPSLLLFTLGLRDRGKTEEKVFARFFRGWPEERFAMLSEQVALRYKHIMRPKIMQKMQEYTGKGETVLVICAAGDLWVKAFLKDIPDIQIVATKLEVYNGQLTGRFASPYCSRMEKVRRLMKLYPERKNYKLVVYGDSRDDTELLDFAEEGHLL